MMKNECLIEQKSWVDSYLKRGSRVLSSHSFISLFAWADFFDYELKIINEHLCVFARSPEGCFMYWPPLGGEFDSSTIKLAFEHMAQGKKIKAINRIENIPENLLSAFSKDSYNQYQRPLEYLYRKEDLTALKGNAYKSQRHDCNFFLAHHPKYTFEPYTNADFDSCQKLFDRWAQHRAKAHPDMIYQSMLNENRQVHERLLKFWHPLGLVVRVLKVDGEMMGYTFGFALNETTFCIYAEIADLAMRGSAAYMFKSFCSDSQLKSFSRINTMDDFALPNITRAKESYHPLERISSYTISVI